MLVVRGRLARMRGAWSIALRYALSPFLKIAGGLLLIAWISSMIWARHTPTTSLPTGILDALHEDEALCCKETSGKFEESCHQNFVTQLQWRQLQLTPFGKTGILVENSNRGFCGSAGCALSLFLREPDGSYVEVLDEIGALRSVKILKSVTRGHYDLQKTASDRKSRIIYRWDGSLYVHQQE